MGLDYTHRKIMTQHGARDSVDLGGDLFFLHQVKLLDSLLLRFSSKSIFSNGISQRIIKDPATDLRFSDGVNDLPFSVSWWMKTIPGQQPRIMYFGAGNSAQAWEIFGADVEHYLQLTLASTGSASITRTADKGLLEHANSWVMAGTTYDGSGSGAGITMYLNGQVLPSTASAMGNYTTMREGNRFKIAARRSNNLYVGNMDSVAVWNAELTAADMRLIYQAGRPWDLTRHPKHASSLQNWWRLGEVWLFPMLPDVVGLNDLTITNGTVDSVVMDIA